MSHDWAKGDPGPIKESNSSGPKWDHIIFNENNKYEIFMSCKVSILQSVNSLLLLNCYSAREEK